MIKRDILNHVPKGHFLALATAGLLMGTGLILGGDPANADGDTRDGAKMTVEAYAAVEPGPVPSSTPEPDLNGPVAPGEPLPDDPASAILADILDPHPPAEPLLMAALERNVPASIVQEFVPTPIAAPVAQIEWASHQVRRGDTLSSVFKRAGLSSRLLYDIDQDIRGNQWSTIHPGEELEVGMLDGSFHSLKIHRSELEKWLISKDEESGRFAMEKVELPTTSRTRYAEGVIDDNLFLAGTRSGLSNGLIMELANLFGWDIDFVLDIRKGDSFRLLYEEVLLEGTVIDHGDILAAEFISQGERFTAIRFEDTQGQVQYYNAEGESLKKAFLRSPISFARISSHFDLKRKHPVLHRFRAHRGTDYAAATGTPIKATGDGKIIFQGWKGGYGNVVILQHGQGITTLYAHMSKFRRGLGTGKRVQQGQIIGYVGSTGLATGPHLHYEFRKHGVHKNPVTVKLPDAAPIPSEYRERFAIHAESALGQLQEKARAYALAVNEAERPAFNPSL